MSLPLTRNLSVEPGDKAGSEGSIFVMNLFHSGYEGKSRKALRTMDGGALMVMFVWIEGIVGGKQASKSESKYYGSAARLHPPIVVKSIYMSRASKITLLTVTLATCSTILFVHRDQANEKAVPPVPCGSNCRRCMRALSGMPRDRELRGKGF